MSIDEIIKIYEEWISELELIARYNDNNVCVYLRYNAVGETIKLLKEYRWIFSDIPEDHDLISKIESAMGFKLFLWQKVFIARNEFRQTGETTAKILRRLTKSDEPIDLTRIMCAKERFEAQETIRIYERLKAAGVKTCPVFRTKKERAEYMRRNKMNNTKLQIGDTIKCHDKNDLVHTMYELQAEGIETDFLFEKDGEKGLWLKVEKISKSKDN